MTTVASFHDDIKLRRAKILLGITFLATRLKSAAKPPDGLDGLRPDPLTVRGVKAGVRGTEFF